MDFEKVAEFDAASIRAENDQLRRLLADLRREAKEALRAMEREAWEAGKSICRAMADLTEAEQCAGQARGEAEYRMLLQRLYLDRKNALRTAAEVPEGHVRFSDGAEPRVLEMSYNPISGFTYVTLIGQTPAKAAESALAPKDNRG